MPLAIRAQITVAACIMASSRVAAAAFAHSVRPSNVMHSSQLTLLVRPSNARDWSPDQERLATATFSGDSVHIENVRNAVYRSVSDYDVRWERRSYDLVLLEVAAPDSEGLGLLAELREREVSAPILLISGPISVEQAARAMRLGARGLMLKPFEPGELQATALEIVRERRAVRSSDGMRR